MPASIALCIASMACASPEGRPEGTLLVRLPEGTWIDYKGTLEASTRAGEEDRDALSASLEVAYLCLGAGEAAAGADRGLPVLLLRDAEAPEDAKVAATEAVSLRLDGDLVARAEIPVADRLAASKVLFSYVPLGIFPSLRSARPGRWRGPVRMAALFASVHEVMAAHRVEPLEGQLAGGVLPAGAIRYTVEAEPGQKLACRQDGGDLLLEAASLVQAFTVAADAGALLRFESRLQGTIAGASGARTAVRVEIDLLRVASQRVSGPAWDRLREDGARLVEIERALFVDLNPDGAQSRAAAFEKERGESRLARFAAGFGRQADAVWPIAHERRLYGKPAPDFTLRGLDGAEVNLASRLPGKVTLLSFFSLG